MPLAVVTHNPGPGGELGHLGRWLSEHSFEVTRVSRVEPIPPDIADAADLLIMLGSLWSVARPIHRWEYAAHAARAIESEVQVVRRRQAANLPTLGICFGGQLLCHALGGTVEHLDSGIFMDWDLPASDIDELTAPWFFIHEDHMRLPEGAEPLARSDHATVAFRQGNAWGLQFHPEVDVDVLRLWFDDLGFDSARTSPHMRCVEERAERNRKDAFALFDRFWHEARQRQGASV